jgi:hypothetical protein
MDGERFDALIRRLGTTRLTRMRALRGVAGSAAALMAAALVATTEAADRRRRKRTICHCPDTDPKNCTTLRLRRRRARRHLRRHPNDYKGECRKQPKPAPTCTTDADCAATGQVCCTTGKKAGTCQPNLNAC